MTNDNNPQAKAIHGMAVSMMMLGAALLVWATLGWRAALGFYGLCLCVLALAMIGRAHRIEQQRGKLRG